MFAYLLYASLDSSKGLSVAAWAWQAYLSVKGATGSGLQLSTRPATTRGAREEVG